MTIPNRPHYKHEECTPPTSASHAETQSTTGEVDTEEVRHQKIDKIQELVNEIRGGLLKMFTVGKVEKLNAEIEIDVNFAPHHFRCIQNWKVDEHSLQSVISDQIKLKKQINHLESQLDVVLKYIESDSYNLSIKVKKEAKSILEEYNSKENELSSIESDITAKLTQLLDPLGCNQLKSMYIRSHEVCCMKSKAEILQFCLSELDRIPSLSLKEIGCSLSRPKKRRFLSAHAKQILRRWFDEHRYHPYPLDEEKEKLAVEAGINIEQVNNWFINTRGREWKPGMKALMETRRCEVNAEDKERLKDLMKKMTRKLKKSSNDDNK